MIWLQDTPRAGDPSPLRTTGRRQAVENVFESEKSCRGYLLRRSPPEDEEPLDGVPLLLRLRDEPLEDLVCGAGEDLPELDLGALLAEGAGWLRLRLGVLRLALGRGSDFIVSRERLGAGRE